LDLETNWQVVEKQTKDNPKNGKEYAGLVETPYWNLMLDKWVTKTKERPTRHRLFLPQEVVQCEIWIGDFKRKHNYRRQSLRKEMQSITHPNEWVQYIYQPHSMVQSQRDQDGAGIVAVPNQLQEISSPKLVIS
jgi:hypothetical protein